MRTPASAVSAREVAEVGGEDSGGSPAVSLVGEAEFRRQRDLERPPLGRDRVVAPGPEPVAELASRVGRGAANDLRLVPQPRHQHRDRGRGAHPGQGRTNRESHQRGRMIVDPEYLGLEPRSRLVPDPFQVGDQERFRTGPEMRWLRPDRVVPARRPGAGVDASDRHKRPLCLAKRRLELLVRVRVEPAAEGLLLGQQGDDALANRGMIGGDPGEAEGIERFAGLHLSRRGSGVELDRPVAPGVLDLEEPGDVGLDLRLVPDGIGQAETDRLGREVADGVGLAGWQDSGHHVAGRGGVRIAGPFEDEVELAPGVGRHLVAADGVVAVGLVGGNRLAAVVVEAEELGDRAVGVVAVGDLEQVFLVHEDCREPAQHVRRRGDHPGPDGAVMAVERDGVIRQSLEEKPGGKRLFELVAVADGRERRLGREVGWVAADAGRDLVVDVGHAVGRLPLARGVGVPAIARQELEVHRRADGLAGGGGDLRRVAGLLRLQVRRRVEELRPQLVLGLAGLDEDVIGPLREDAGRELVGPGAGRPLALEALGIAPAGVFDGLARRVQRVDADVGRDVAVDVVDADIEQFRMIRREVEAIPVLAGGLLGGGRLLSEREIGTIVSEGVDGPAEVEAVGRGGRVVRLVLEGDAVG